MTGHGFRDVELEEQVLELTRKFGIGAQFGGKYFCHDVRVIRLPRHGASLPVAVASPARPTGSAWARSPPRASSSSSWSSSRGTSCPDLTSADSSTPTEARCGWRPARRRRRDRPHRPMPEILAELTKHPVKTRLSLTGTLVVARDIAHAKIKERLDAGEPMPRLPQGPPGLLRRPGQDPAGMASGSFGPTTAGRMDSYVDQFQAAGGSMVMLAKGNRSQQVTDACATHGGFYLGSIGGPAARLAQDCIKSVEVLEYPELGMEAVWKIEVEDFPAFIVVDDKGNDFFASVTNPSAHHDRQATRASERLDRSSSTHTPLGTWDRHRAQPGTRPTTPQEAWACCRRQRPVHGGRTRSPHQDVQLRHRLANKQHALRDLLRLRRLAGGGGDHLRPGPRRPLRRPHRRSRRRLQRPGVDGVRGRRARRPLIVVLGHDSCGAVKAAVDAVDQRGHARRLHPRHRRARHPERPRGRKQGETSTDEIEPSTCGIPLGCSPTRSDAHRRRIARGTARDRRGDIPPREGEAKIVESIGMDPPKLGLCRDARV
jgi:tartrate/fumarate subfamily iron-sulfur-dependent hydro-lyase beta chain